MWRGTAQIPFHGERVAPALGVLSAASPQLPTLSGIPQGQVLPRVHGEKNINKYQERDLA